MSGDPSIRRRRVLQAFGAGGLGALGAGAATANPGKGNGGGGGGDGGGGGGGSDVSDTNNDVIMQYFHEEWTTVENDISTISDVGYDAIWLQQPAESYLDWSDQDGRNDPPLGYQPVDFTNFNSSFGTESELQSLIDTAHSYGVDVYLDTVMNHMAAADYSNFPQFGYEHFHHDVGEITDWSDEHQVKHGELLGLKDLGQIEHIDGDPAYVRGELQNYMDKMVQEFGADGYRYDAAKHMYESFFSDYANSWAANNNAFGFGEVYSGDVNYVQNYVDTGMAALDYPLFFPLRNAFNYGDLSQLRGAGLVAQSPSDALPFVDNHDEDAPSQYKLAYAFASTVPGVAVHYNLYPDWLLGETDINNMVWTKKNLASGPLKWHHDATDSIVFEREGNLIVGINNGGSDTSVRVKTPWGSTTLKDYAGNMGSITTKKNGQVQVPIPAEGWVFYAP